MKVKFKTKWFGPTDFIGEGFISTSGQRFRAGFVYDLPDNFLEYLPKKDVIFIDDGEEKTAEQFNKDKFLKELEEAKKAEADIANQQAALGDALEKMSTPSRGRPKKTDGE